MKKTKIYFDTEFTGLLQNTTLISIGIVSEDGKNFYAEFNDYDKTQVDEWLQENVIDNLKYDDVISHVPLIPVDNPDVYEIKADTETIKNKLVKWLKQFGDIEVWSDCLAYDWVLFNQIFGHAFSIPENVYYIPFDLCTALKLKGVDPDINREEFAGFNSSNQKHNALWDANIIKLCCEKLDI